MLKNEIIIHANRIRSRENGLLIRANGIRSRENEIIIRDNGIRSRENEIIIRTNGIRSQENETIIHNELLPLTFLKNVVYKMHFGVQYQLSTRGYQKVRALN